MPNQPVDIRADDIVGGISKDRYASGNGTVSALPEVDACIAVRFIFSGNDYPDRITPGVR